MPLLEWLERCALPEEARLADIAYAREIADEFTAALVGSGTTTALVFGSHFAPSGRPFFAEGHRARPSASPSGLVVGDRMLRPELHTTAQRAYDEARWSWPGDGTRRAAPGMRSRRGSPLSCTDELLDACSAAKNDIEGSWFTSHINENPAEITKVRSCSDVATSTAMTATVWSAPTASSRTTCTRRTAELKLSGRHRRVRRPLPDEQRRARERAVPARPPPRHPASGWRSAPMSAPAPGSHCSRRACRHTSCSSCAAPRACP